MLLPPEHVDTELVRNAVADQYGTIKEPLVFEPLGEDSWAFRGGEFWISVRRDLRGHVPGAYEAAALLRDSGLDYVLAPLAGADGGFVREVSGSPVVVFPLVRASQLVREEVAPDEFEKLIDMVRRVHGAQVRAHVPTEDYRLDFADDLAAVLGFADGLAPKGGGYPARLHSLLSAHRGVMTDLCGELRNLAAVCSASTHPLVLTHGEPSAANFLRGGERLLLADWGGARWGPPERDWFHVRRTLGSAPPCRPEFMRFYEIRWILSEITEYSIIFREERPGNEDDLAMWKRLVHYLPEDQTG